MTFEQFASNRIPALLASATAISGNKWLAEDLVQDVLIKVHKHWAMISGLEAPDSYIRKMLVNEFLSWRRKWARITPRSEVEPSFTQADPAAAMVDRAALVADIRRLPRQQQVVIGLRYFGDLSDAEIADAMGCTAGTVRGYASRALATLRINAVSERSVT